VLLCRITLEPTAVAALSADDQEVAVTVYVQDGRVVTAGLGAAALREEQAETPRPRRRRRHGGPARAAQPRQHRQRHPALSVGARASGDAGRAGARGLELRLGASSALLWAPHQAGVE
jgi:hypothetical protein